MDKRPTIDELEKILNSEDADRVNIRPDGTVEMRNDEQVAQVRADRVIDKDRIIERLKADNTRLRAALHEMTKPLRDIPG